MICLVCELYLNKAVFKKEEYEDFSGGPVVKNPPANAGDMGSVPDLGRSFMLWSN